MNPKNRVPRFHGQSIGEYGIIIALIAVIAIPAVTVLSDNIGKLFTSGSGIRKAVPARVVASVPVAATPTAPVTTTLPSASPAITPQPSPPTLTPGVGLVLQNGTVISLPRYPQDLGKSVETAGANGTTTLLADSLQSAAKQLLASGQIDQAQYNSLNALANQAYRMAGLDKLIENGAATSGSNMSFDLKFMAAMADPQQSAVWQLGYTGNSGGAADVKNPLTQPRPNAETAQLISLYNQALNSGALKDPAVQQMVRTMTSQVAFLGEVSADAGLAILRNQASPAEALQHMPADAALLNASGICSTGGGTSAPGAAGIHCT